MNICDDCKAEISDGFLTEVNPRGGYGMPRTLICDQCMESDCWDEWRAKHWPNWPNEPNTARVVRCHTNP